MFVSKISKVFAPGTTIKNFFLLVYHQHVEILYFVYDKLLLNSTLMLLSRNATLANNVNITSFVSICT